MVEVNNNSNFIVLNVGQQDQLEASWQVTDVQKEFIEQYFHKPFSSFLQILRICDVTQANQVHEVMLPPNQHHWVIKGLKPGRCYCLELCIRLSEHELFPYLRSEIIQVPGSLHSDIREDKRQIHHPEQPTWSNQVSTYSYYEQHDRKDSWYAKLPASICSKRTKKSNVRHPIITSSNNSKLKIVMLTWEYPPNVIGGLASHVEGLSKALVKVDCEVHVVTLHIGKLKKYEMIEGVQIHRVTPLNGHEPHFLTWIAGLNSSMIDKVTQLAQEHQFDVIHAHDWLVSTAAIVVSQSLNIPLVATIHSTEHGRSEGIHTSIQAFIHEKELRLVEEAKIIIVCSQFMKEELRQVFDVKGTCISTIPNGVEPYKNLLQSKPVEIPLNALNKRIIFSLGRMVKEKGFETIIQAVKPLIELHPSIHFIIGGSGPLLEEYNQIVAERKLQTSITFIGSINKEQRHYWFQQCDLAIFPSLYEPFGIVALEAMIEAKPTVVSNTGGFKEVVQHLKTGLLMNPGDPSSLFQQVHFLLENEVVAKKLGELGKKVAESKYNWKKIGIETKRIYNEVKYK